ncbi:hypothetical protein D3C87_1969930 [compost metagenome]
MIVLDENGVIQRIAVVGATTAPHRVFLESPQPGRGLARIADLRARTGNRIGIFARQRGNAAQVIEEVQCHPLRRHHQPGRARHLSD